jgi:3-hydroxyacyl-CoA dehydrogenase
MDAIAAPHCVLASSTSSIPASAFTEELSGRSRCLIAHPVNPPYLIPVVEICGAPWTNPKVVQKTWDVMESVGQKPVKIYKELEGFILNRLQGALLREAFRLVEQGYVDADGLDVTVREGLGLRWSFMGPFETIDLNAPEGLADYAHRFNNMYQSISTEQTATEHWSEDVIQKLEAERRAILPKDQLLARRLWRDRRLMGLAAHKKNAEKNTK